MTCQNVNNDQTNTTNEVSKWECLTGREIYDLWPDDLSLFKWQELAHKIEDILWEKNK